jgi:hypothetical protein
MKLTKHTNIIEFLQMEFKRLNEIIWELNDADIKAKVAVSRPTILNNSRNGGLSQFYQNQFTTLNPLGRFYYQVFSILYIEYYDSDLVMENQSLMFLRENRLEILRWLKGDLVQFIEPNNSPYLNETHSTPYHLIMAFVDFLERENVGLGATPLLKASQND